jgi:hypothetical protein
VQHSAGTSLPSCQLVSYCTVCRLAHTKLKHWLWLYFTSQQCSYQPLAATASCLGFVNMLFCSTDSVMRRCEPLAIMTYDFGVDRLYSGCISSGLGPCAYFFVSHPLNGPVLWHGTAPAPTNCCGWSVIVSSSLPVVVAGQGHLFGIAAGMWPQSGHWPQVDASCRCPRRQRSSRRHWSHRTVFRCRE